MSMSVFARVGVLFLVSCALIGCASVPESRPFNAGLHDDIESIALLPVPDTEPSVHIVNNPGYSFGLVGLMIAEGAMQSRRTWFRDEVAEADLQHQSYFVEVFEQAMAQRGYELVLPDPLLETEDTKAGRNSWGIRSEYDPVPGDEAQAMLDMAFVFAGMASPGAGSGSAYRPTVVVSARLLDESGEEELFFDYVVYNDVFPAFSHGVVIYPDPDYAYDDFEALQAADSVTVDGFKLALEEAANKLAAQFPPRT